MERGGFPLAARRPGRTEPFERIFTVLQSDIKDS